MAALYQHAPMDNFLSLRVIIDEVCRFTVDSCQSYLEKARALVRAAPECVHSSDSQGRRPIDTLSSTIVNYKLLFLSNVQQRNLSILYECAGYSVAAHANVQHKQQPLVHVCLQARNIPVALVERAMQRFGPDQIQLRDEDGNLPLH
jgi:hypothetical protein